MKFDSAYPPIWVWKLVYRPNGLDAYFKVDEGGIQSLPVSDIKAENMGKLLPLKQKKQPAAALNLSSEFLPVEGIGWGSGPFVTR